MDKKFYKVLVSGESCYSGSMTWSLPSGEALGDWQEVTEPLQICKVGLHVTDQPAKWYKENCDVYLVEIAGETTAYEESNAKIACARVRLIKKLDAAELAAVNIFIEGEHSIDNGFAIAAGTSTVSAYDSSTVRAFGSSTVSAYGSSTVTAYGSSTVRAYDSSMVTSYDSSMVTAYDSSTVSAYGSNTVTSYGSSTVSACGSNTVTSCGNSTVTSYGSNTVSAHDSSTVTSYGSNTVSAHDSSTVTAYGSSTVTSCGNSTVSASDSSTVTAYGSSVVIIPKNYSTNVKVTLSEEAALIDRRGSVPIAKIGN
jgi:hypothetical protein